MDFDDDEASEYDDMSFTTQQQYDTEFIERQTLGSIKSKKPKARRDRAKGISDWRASN
mgnify:CR=1 FL=1